VDVLCIGETMVLGSAPRGYRLDDTPSVALDIAGAEANVASHLVRDGSRAGWAGAVGADPFGRRVLSTLAGRGVDVSLAQVDDGAHTGVYFKDHGAAGTEVYYYRSGSAASRLGPEFAAGLPLDVVPIVHLSGITPALSASNRALVEAILLARAAVDLPVSFDVNYRAALWSGGEAPDVLLSLARRCPLVFVGRDEAETLWGTSTAAEIRALLPDARLVVKDGAVGAHLFDDETGVFVPTPQVEVVELVGAGDAFAAGFLAGELDGCPAEESLARGHAFAARAIATTGDY
jgi:2-dehydro-3-deoxygluconokinase